MTSGLILSDCSENIAIYRKLDFVWLPVGSINVEVIAESVALVVARGSIVLGGVQ